MSAGTQSANLHPGVKLPGLSVLMLALMLSGCASEKTSAPLIERAPAAKKAPAKAKAVTKEGDWRPQTYVVQKGDTLYGIALEHGFDYKEVAEWNGIEPPYTIRVGQQLKLASDSQKTVVVTPLKAATVAEVRPNQDSLLKTQPKAVKQPYVLQGDSDPLRSKAHVDADQADKPVLTKT
ncbi:MAG: LysM peptidoglycan-binding domain-containing protein, partial [Betaproteobacteria bacterium]